ncbi:MAG TPA: GMP/IMP nucleotidase [Acidiferrobacter sp.]|nr:GMP/IMP nucleotidase [Acidiferrobacter sp.]
MIDWDSVETVFLDMDGTLLDLHFDNHFWQEHVPLRYAEQNGLPLDEAKAVLYQRFRRDEGTLNWYSVDYWSDELALDIAKLKEEVAERIGMRPHVEEFLAATRDAGKRLVLVTNAHGKTVALKFRETRIDQYMDAVVCAHDLGIAKEHPPFWGQLRELQPFDPARTLLIDDSLPVLRCARTYGIKHLLAVRKPDLRAPDKDCAEFTAIDSFRSLLPIR